MARLYADRYRNQHYLYYTVDSSRLSITRDGFTAKLNRRRCISSNKTIAHFAHWSASAPHKPLIPRRCLIRRQVYAKHQTRSSWGSIKLAEDDVRFYYRNRSVEYLFSTLCDYKLTHPGDSWKLAICSESFAACFLFLLISLFIFFIFDGFDCELVEKEKVCWKIGRCNFKVQLTLTPTNIFFFIFVFGSCKLYGKVKCKLHKMIGTWESWCIYCACTTFSVFG